MSEAFAKPSEIASARGDEMSRCLKLRDADGRLHIGDL